MLTDRTPYADDDDHYIRCWAAARNTRRMRKFFVPLVSASQHAPNMAEVDCGTPGWPVRRFNDTPQFKLKEKQS